MRILKIGNSTLEDIFRINLAFQLEKEHPDLSFFEVNKLVEEQIGKIKARAGSRKLNLIKSETGDLSEPSALK